MKEVNGGVVIQWVSLEANLREPRSPQLEEATCYGFQVQRSAVRSAESLLFSWSSPTEMGLCINRNCNRLVLSVLHWELRMSAFAV